MPPTSSQQPNIMSQMRASSTFLSEQLTTTWSKSTADTSGNKTPNSKNKSDRISYCDTSTVANNTRRPSSRNTALTITNNNAAAAKTTTGRSIASSNKLHRLIEYGKWDDVVRFLQSGAGSDMAAEIYPKSQGGDLPLHVVCDFDFARHMHGNGRGVVEDRNEEQEACVLPPQEVVLSLLEAYPDAARTRGHLGCLPLHLALKKGHQKNVLEALIRTFPQALDVKDVLDKTPREYLDHCDSEIAVMLERPTICWLQQTEDDDARDEIDCELHDLESEMEMLKKEVEDSLIEEKKMLAKLIVIEQHVSGYKDRKQFDAVSRQLAEFETFVGDELETIERSLDSVSKKLYAKYEKDKCERGYIKSFIDDVMKVYEELDDNLSMYKMEIEKMKEKTNYNALRK